MNNELNLAWIYIRTVLGRWWLILIEAVLILADPLERFFGISLVPPLWLKLTMGVGALALAQYLAYRDQAKLKKPAPADASSKPQRKRGGVPFAALIEEGNALTNRLEAAQTAAEVTDWVPSRQAWRDSVIEALNDAGMRADAIAFSHTPDKSSGSVLWTYTHIPSWKRLHWVELMLYRDKLQEIGECRKH